MAKILLLEGIHHLGSQFLKDEGNTVEESLESYPEEKIIESIKESNFDALGIRSKTHITKNIVESCSDQLSAVGAFCIGTNQIDLKDCQKYGIAVFNAPYSNTRSVAELVISEMISLSRKTFYLSSLLHKGVWQKKAKGSFEVRNKTLGIIGYGHIGTQLGLLAESLGMNVIYHDLTTKLPLGTANPSISLSELLKTSDFVSLHVPETRETKGMIGEKEIGLMKPSSYLINASRGSVVDIKALSEAIKDKKLAGAAIDVFPSEPRKNGPDFKSELCGLDNVILTPHIGGSTEEAQKNIGQEVSFSLQQYFALGDTSGAVNFPKVIAPNINGDYRIVHIHKNVPGVLAEVNSVISELGVNINYQSLSTLENIGYLLMDFQMNEEQGRVLRDKLKASDKLIRIRLIKNS